MPKSGKEGESIVTSGETPKRLDLFLAARDLTWSRAAPQRLIQGGNIRLNGLRIKPSQKIRPGDRITLDITRPEPLELQPEPIPLDIVYEDESILVLNKPAGLVVHPAPGHWSGTLVNALLHHCGSPAGALSRVGGKERPGLVHVGATPSPDGSNPSDPSPSRSYPSSGSR